MTALRRSNPQRLRPTALAVLLGMLVLVGAVALGAWRYEETQEDRTREEWARRAAVALDNQVAQTGAAVVAARGLFEASDDVDKGESTSSPRSS